MIRSPGGSANADCTASIAVSTTHDARADARPLGVRGERPARRPRHRDSVPRGPHGPEAPPPPPGGPAHRLAAMAPRGVAYVAPAPGRFRPKRFARPRG